MSKLLGYVLISDGAHPDDDIFHCERAAPQIRTLKALSRKLDLTLSIRYDYRRELRRLDQLPVLVQSLSRMKDHGAGLLVVECLARLLQKPDFQDRAAFLNELMQFSDHLYGALQDKRLRNYDNRELATLITNKPPRRPVPASQPRLKRNTAPAMLKSEFVRKDRSKKAAVLLAGIKQELIDQGLPATLGAIATEANARGLRTQRGSEWTEATVSYQLRKLIGASK